MSGSRRRAGVALMLMLMLCLIGLAPAVQAAARVTIVDGEATLVDGDRTLGAVEGLAVGEETLVRTTAKTTLLRIEWPDGTVADFGPDTQAMLEPAGFGARGGRSPSVYLMRGWLKASALGGAAAPGLLTPRLDVQPFKGTLVVMVSGSETWAFAESGSVPLSERELKPPSSPTLKNGEVYLRDGAAKGNVQPRPTPEQMRRVPRGFRDSLPLRGAAFKDRVVTARPGPPPAYAELREWLAAEKPLRKNFTKRFAQRARDPAFRAGLVEDLSHHPEWERVLFPERFVKPSSAPR